MKAYIDKSALVAEIEKLQLCTMDEHMNFYSAEAQGEYNALSKLESFIDTLEVEEVEEKPVGNDLEDAAHQYAWDKQEHHIDFDGDEYLDYGVRFDSFKAGAQWQKEQMITKACEWLRTNYEDIGIRYIRGHKAEDEIESFKKAMEE